MTPAVFPHLTPAYPHRTGLHHCDICFEGEHADIVAGRADVLRPMYRDSRDGCVICLRCAESGAYLEIEPPCGGQPTALRQGSLLDAIAELRAAGGDAWDGVADPAAYLGRDGS